MSTTDSPRTDQARGGVHEIIAGGYRAVITEVGATLNALELHGRPLLVEGPLDRPMLFFRGAIVAPWPNRIGDGRYTWDGQEIQAALNEPDRGCALHGLVSFQHYEVVEAQESSLTLATDLYPSTAYPFHLRLQVTYALDAQEGLLTTVLAQNVGDQDLPYGVCPHPYLVAGPEPLDTWSLQVQAASVLEVDEDRLLPIGLAPVERGGELDFSEPRVIGSQQIDHAFTGLARMDGIFAVTLRSPSGTGVVITADERCPWVQVHTGDRPEPEFDRSGMAVEPMTCPPDAFRSGTDVIRMAPGEQNETAWRIRGI